MTQTKSAFVAVALGKAAQILAAIVSVRLLTSLLSPTELGRYYLISSLLASFSWVLLNPVSTYFGRMLLEWDEAGVTLKHFTRYTIYGLAVSLLAFFILGVLIELGVSRIAVSALFLAISCLGGILVAELVGTLLSNLNLRNRRIPYAVLSNLKIWLGISLGALMVHYRSPSAENWLLGTFMGTGLTLVLLLYSFNHEGGSRGHIINDDRSFTLASIFHFSWPFSVSLMFNWMQFHGYRVSISATAGDGFLGTFGAALAISAGIFGAFESLLTQFYQPIFYKKINGADQTLRAGAFSEYLTLTLATVIPVGAFVIALAPQLLQVMAGPQYHDLSHLVRLLVIVEVLRVVSGVYFMGALSEKNPRLLLWPRLLAGLAAQLGVVVLFPVFGPTAATFTALACAGAILLVGSALNVNRVLVAPIKWRKISLSIASSTILLILLALLSMLLKSGIVQAFAAIVGGVVSLGIAEYVIIRNRSGEVNNSPRNSS